MKLFSEISLLFKRKILETMRQPIWIISGLTVPLLYLILFGPLLEGLNRGNEDVLNIFLPGILSLLAFTTGMGAGWGVIWELQSGVIERLRVMPIYRFSFMIGSVLKDVITFIIQVLLVILIGSIFGFDIHWGGIAILLLLLSMMTAIISAWSASLGLVFQDIGSLAAVVTGLQLPLTLLSGAMLPISLGPKWLQIIAHFNPLYYTVEASRILAKGTINSSEVIHAFIIIVPLTIIVLGWATQVYRKAIS